MSCNVYRSYHPEFLFIWQYCTNSKSYTASDNVTELMWEGSSHDFFTILFRHVRWKGENQSVHVKFLTEIWILVQISIWSGYHST
jgi:hypothetical protein